MGSRKKKNKPHSRRWACVMSRRAEKLSKLHSQSLPQESHDPLPQSCQNSSMQDNLEPPFLLKTSSGARSDDFTRVEFHHGQISETDKFLIHDSKVLSVLTGNNACLDFDRRDGETLKKKYFNENELFSNVVLPQTHLHESLCMEQAFSKPLLNNNSQVLHEPDDFLLLSRTNSIEKPIRTYGSKPNLMISECKGKFSSRNGCENICQSIDEIINNDEKHSFPDSNVYHTDESSKICSSVNVEHVDGEVDGRVIIHFPYFFEELHKKFDNHHPTCQGALRNLRLLYSRNSGMRVQFFFQCMICSLVESIWSEELDPPNIMPLHESVVCGSIAAGIGYATTQTLLAAMRIKSMCHVLYRGIRDKLSPLIDITTDKTMQEAARSERDQAIAVGDVTADGTPFITVIVDGAWSKRSYKGGRYDALSGTGVIIGLRTGQILFLGVRNKYCSICARAERFDSIPSEHICFKNWGRNQASTAMEADIIAEGFNRSIELHKLIYKSYIGDGDSNVYQTILNNNPYSDYGIRVYKIECRNHLFRNFCNNIRLAAKVGKSTPAIQGRLIRLRQHVEHSASKMQKSVKNLIARHQAEKVSNAEKSKRLMHDILNTPGHFYGDHEHCNPMDLSCNLSEENIVPLLRDIGIYQQIEMVVERLARNSVSLLANETNNAAELYNSIANGFYGGRRINFSCRNSFQLRAEMAVLQHNTHRALSEVNKAAGCNVSTTITDMENSRIAQVTRTREFRQQNCSKRHHIYGTDENYGPASTQPDMYGDVLEQRIALHYETLKERQQDRKNIERETVSQSECDKWHLYRKQMITESKFGEICRMKESTSCSRLVIDICYSKFKSTPDMIFGKDNEPIAREQLALALNKKIHLAGLFIDKDKPYLGASPDGLIDADGIVKIKCLAKAKSETPDTALRKYSVYKNILTKGTTEIMNRSHKYYYQVQGQLHITEREYCIFALWTPFGLKHVKVNRDDKFWEEEMEWRLIRFYEKCVIPEIVDARYIRNLPIREPEYIVKAQEIREKRMGTQAIPTKKRQNKKTIIPISKRFRANSPSPKILKNNIVHIRGSNNVSNVQDDRTIDLFHRTTTFTDEEVVEMRDILDNLRVDINKCNVIANITTSLAFLNDDSIELFLQILEQDSEYNYCPVLYFAYQHLIEPVTRWETREIQIIGGYAFQNWCGLHYNGSKIFIFDSIGRNEYAKLKAEEKSFMMLRYPEVSIENIHMMRTTYQPDGSSCGVYAAAFATTIAMGGDPSVVRYSRNACLMRQHMARIVETRRLEEFPRESA